MPQGTEIAGSPEILAVTVHISVAYIFNGSSVFSPILNAVVGTVGAAITSISENASENSADILL